MGKESTAHLSDGAFRVLAGLLVLLLAAQAWMTWSAWRDLERETAALRQEGGGRLAVICTEPPGAVARFTPDGGATRELGRTPLLFRETRPGSLQLVRPGFHLTVPVPSHGLPSSTPLLALQEDVPWVSSLLHRWPLFTASLAPAAALTVLALRRRARRRDEAEALDEVSYVGEGGRVGRYRLERLLGRGEMAEVYLGRAGESPPVAVKVLHERVSASDEFRRRFDREAAITRTLCHAGIVGVSDAGDEGGRLYLVMELVGGTSLRARIEEGGMAVAEAVRIAGDALDALAYAHERGIVHRDLKPDNILLTPAGQVKVADFGLARGDEHATLTEADTTLGTPAYIPPEQIAGRRASGAADQYSMGCVLFELLTGRPPFVADDPLMIIYQHAAEPAPSVSSLRDDVPAALDGAVARLLEKEPEARFPDAATAARTLRAALPA